MGQLSGLNARVLGLKLAVRSLASGADTVRGSARSEVSESKALAEAAGRLWRVLDALHGKANFNPNQPRVPRGNPDGGQWTDDLVHGGPETESDGDEGQAAASREHTFIERMNEQAYQRFFAILLAAGHHLVPLAVVRRLGIPADTAKVLGDTTGPLLPPRHRWDEAHAKYSREAEKEIIKFAQARGKLPRQLTPDDGRDLMKEFWHSKNPVIRQFNLNVFRTELARRIARRGGRR